MLNFSKRGWRMPVCAYRCALGNLTFRIELQIAATNRFGAFCEYKAKFESFFLAEEKVFFDFVAHKMRTSSIILLVNAQQM